MTSKEAIIILGNKPAGAFDFNDWLFYISVYNQFGWRQPRLDVSSYGIPEKFQTQELILALKLS